MRTQQYLALLKNVGRNFWRDLTTPAWFSAWRQLAEEMGCELQPPTLWRAGYVRQSHRGFLIELSNILDDSASFTRVRTCLESASDFKFSLYQSNVLNKIANKFGLPRFVSGHREFDDAFHVTGSSPTYLTILLGTAAIRERLLLLPQLHFSLSPQVLQQSFRLSGAALSGTAILQTDTLTMVTDLAQLKRLLELQQRTIDVLIDTCQLQCPAPATSRAK